MLAKVYREWNFWQHISSVDWQRRVQLGLLRLKNCPEKSARREAWEISLREGKVAMSIRAHM